MRKVKTIAFETEAKRLYLLAKEILYIQAEGHNCHVYTISGNCYIIRLTMAQCARLIDESTYFASSDFVLLGRNLIINYRRLSNLKFTPGSIPLKTGIVKDGKETVIEVTCQNVAWRDFYTLLAEGDAAMVSYQQERRKKYIDATLSSDCSLIGFMTSSQVIAQDYYVQKSPNDFIILGGSNMYPIYTEGNKDEYLADLEKWARQTVVDVDKEMRRQPTPLVNRAYKADGTPKFDVVLSYEKYEEERFTHKPSERLKALQKKFNESYEANLQKIISDSEMKKNDEKKGNESFESLGMYDYIRAMNRISRELSEHGDHPSCYRLRPLGQYRYKGRNGRPEIVLFLKNTYDAEKSWDRKKTDEPLPSLNEVVTLTYIHELMHAVMHSKNDFPYIEEPLAEMGMLCFVHDALRDEKFGGLEEKALNWVKQKQDHEPICHYGFGAFLFDSLYDAEVGWGVGNLMKQYIRVNKKLSEKEAVLDDYEEYFLGGYPWHNLQRSALDKLFVVLGMTRIKKAIPVSKEPLFEWHKNNQAQITETQSRVENYEEDTKDEENLSGGFLSRYEIEEVDDDIFFPHRENWLFDQIANNIKEYEVNLGLNPIDSNSHVLQRESSRYCQDIYIDCLLKILNDKNSWKTLFGSTDDSTAFIDLIDSIKLTHTAVGNLYQYKIEIGF